MEASHLHPGRAPELKVSWAEVTAPRQLGTCKVYLGICQGNASLFWGVSLPGKPGGVWKGPCAHTTHNSVHSPTQQHSFIQHVPGRVLPDLIPSCQ